MANTTIQLKYSTVTSAPTSLNVGEPAYSFSSNIFYIGSPDSTGAIAIGGKFYLDQQQIIFDTANAAFASANNSTKANSAFDQANAAFEVANSAAIAANTPSHVANSAAIYANGAFDAANTADSKAVSAGSYANSAFVHANAAFASSNTKLSASGGTISGSLTVTGNLTVQGNTTFVDTEILSVEDSLIKLANNNTTDALDIGFYGQYEDSSTKYTGLARNAGTNNFFLFRGLTADPAGNTLATGSVTAANAATLIANVQAYSVTINGVNTETYIGNAYAAANTADAKATSAGSYANSAFDHANAGFTAANTASSTATAAGSYANSAFSLANGTAVIANTDFTTISAPAGYYGNGATISSFTLEANGRISQANSTLIGISASQVTVGTLPVARGGTGADTFTTNGVLLGQGASAFTTASSSTEGHVLTINNSGVPTFAHLQGGTF